MGVGDLRASIAAAIGGIDHKRLLFGLSAVAIGIFLLVLVGSLWLSPDLSGLLAGLFGGVFIALLFAGAAAWMMIWLFAPSFGPPRDHTLETALESEFAATLRQLEIARTEALRQVNAKARMRVPLCMGGTVLFWLVSLASKDPPDVFDLVNWTAVAGLAGYAWAGAQLGEAYRQLYKDRVLPDLCARFGDLTYRRPQAIDIAKLAEYRLFEPFDRATSDDEIAGTYHGVPVSITEVHLEAGSGDKRRNVFDGLLVGIMLPRNLSATTAVIVDGGTFGNLAERLRKRSLSRVRLEDPRFEARYEVYGDDQIGARALLTPAFMERLMALGDRPGFAMPVALAEGNRLIVAMPKAYSRDLFEPPGLRRKADGGRVLAELCSDIAAVLAVASSVIDLDHASRSQPDRSGPYARRTPPASAAPALKGPWDRAW